MKGNQGQATAPAQLPVRSTSAPGSPAFPELPVVCAVFRPAFASLRAWWDSCSVGGDPCKHLAVLQGIKNSRVAACAIHPMGIVCSGTELLDMGAELMKFLRSDTLDVQ